MDRFKLSKAEEKRLDELGERADDLTDIDIFIPMEAKQFRQFFDLIRVLGLSHLVTIFEGYLADVVREIFLVHPEALKSARKLTAETVLNLGERKQIVSYLAEKETKKLLNKSFKDVAGKLKVGAYKSITREYLRDSFDSIRTLVEFIDAEVQRKYSST
jgi:hypothetical protein